MIPPVLKYSKGLDTTIDQKEESLIKVSNEITPDLKTWVNSSHWNLDGKV